MATASWVVVGVPPAGVAIVTPPFCFILLLCYALSLTFVLFVFVDEVSRSNDLETAEDDHGEGCLWVVRKWEWESGGF
jgi:hypothetical protein